MFRGKVTKVDTKGVYVQTAEFGTLGPCQAVVANYTVDDMVLCDNVGDEASPELVVVGRLTGTGSTTSGSSVDNTVARFDGSGGALQGSGVTIDDSNRLTVASSTDAYIDVNAAGGSSAYLGFKVAGAARFYLQGSATALSIRRYDAGGALVDVPVYMPAYSGEWVMNNGATVGATAGLEFGSSGPRIMAGTGSPESVVSAPVGSLWLRTDSSTTLYVKQTGTGNTGWIAK